MSLLPFFVLRVYKLIPVTPTALRQRAGVRVEEGTLNVLLR